MKLARSLIAAAITAVSVTVQAADTVVPVVDNNWNQFFFGDAGSSWLNDYPFNDPGKLSFSVTLNGPAVLRVTDAGLAGDAFEVFDNGVLLGSTSTPLGTAADDANGDYAAAFASNKWSHGEWSLTAGTHVITGVTSISVFGAGEGAVQIAAVPEPGKVALMLAGLGLIGLITRRCV